MNKDLGYGPLLSDEEYQQKIIALIKELPPAPSREQDRRHRRKQLELAINQRLGLGYPPHKREALWTIQQRVEKMRLRLILKYLLRKVFRRSLVRDVQGIAAFLVEEYATVLNQAELESYFGEAEARSPALPIETDQLMK